MQTYASHRLLLLAEINKWRTMRCDCVYFFLWTEHGTSTSVPEIRCSAN